jgi:hypothetical protein
MLFFSVCGRVYVLLRKLESGINNMPDMKKVASSNIDSIGYDKASKTLYVSFLSSGTYQYPGVPEEIFQGFEAAKSKGTYFAKTIRPNYKGTKV